MMYSQGGYDRGQNTKEDKYNTTIYTSDGTYSYCLLLLMACKISFLVTFNLTPYYCCLTSQFLLDKRINSFRDKISLIFHFFICSVKQ